MFIVHYFRHKKENQTEKQRNRAKKGITKHTQHKQSNKGVSESLLEESFVQTAEESRKKMLFHLISFLLMQ